MAPTTMPAIVVGSSLTEVARATGRAASSLCAEGNTGKADEIE